MRPSVLGWLLAAVVLATTPACAPGDGGGGGSGTGGGTGGSSGAVVDQPHPVGGASWTVLVYMVADNDLEPFALQDLNEMMQVGSGSGLNLVVQVDRAEGYAADPIGGLPDFTSTKRVLVRSGSLQELSDLGELNMADPATLQDFVTWGLQTYPADRTALVFWDHGGGWSGFGVDEGSGRQLLKLPQIEQGVARGLAGANAKPLSLVGFDACLMATWEVALTLAPHAEYLLASEETEPGHGWDWTSLSLLAQNPSSDPAALGKQVLKGFQAQAAAEQTQDNITLSLIDLYRLGSLGKAIDAVTTTFDGTAPLATAFGRGQERAQKFGDSPEPARAMNLVDLGHLVQETSQEAQAVSGVQQQLLTALGDAVVDHVEGAAKRNARGMAVYFPPDSRFYDAAYDSIPAAQGWRTFLKAYFGTSNSSLSKPTFTNPNKVATTRFDAKGTLIVEGTLEADGVSSLARATVLEGVVSGNSLVVLGEEAATVSGATVQGLWDLSVLSLTQGTTTGFGYASFETVDATKLQLNILFEYRKVPGGAAQDCVRQIVFSADASGAVTMTADTYYVSANGAFGELSPAAGSTLMPIVKTIDLSTGAEALAEGADHAFTTSTGADGKPTFELTLEYRQVVAGKQVFGVLQVENAAGQGDVIVGVAVAP